MESLISTQNLISTAVGVIVGAIFSLIITWIFYKKSSDDLKIKASKLRDLTEIIINGLDNAKIIEVTRTNGEITGLKIKIQSITTASSDLSTAMHVTYDKKE